MLRDFIDDMWPILLFFPATIAGALWLASESEAHWQQFKTDHHCELVGKMEGTAVFSTGAAVGPNGTVGVVPTTSYIPGKEGWKCDDGITYWR
ncbi:hypothetical protein 13AC503A_gene0048 [Aeromonas phage 13AC503A]|nr:hypothetical protein 13AC503A_gene0048 [Aeromonas phage 13AC503A]